VWASYGFLAVMHPVGAVAVAAELSQAFWQASLSPPDRLVENCQPRPLLMMSSLLISLWAEMKLNRKLLFFLMHVNAMTAGNAERWSTMLFMDRSIIQLLILP